MAKKTEEKPKEKKASAKKGDTKKTAPKKKTTKSEKKSDGFAVIETGGKQYTVSVGDVIQIETLPGEHKEGSKVSFDNVLLSDNGSKTDVGSPYIDKKKVEGELVEEGRDRKISVIKFKSKSRYFRRKGHRQPYMKVKITKI